MALKRGVFVDVIFTLLIFILLFVSYISYTQIKGLIDAAYGVNHTNLVKLQLEQTFTHLKDAESAQRGFLLTKDSAFLEPYRSAFEKTNASVIQLDSLTRDNPEETQYSQKLWSLIEKRFNKLNDVLRISSDATQAITPSLVEGKNIMDSIRSQITMMMNLEDHFLRKRIEKRNRYVSITPVTSLVLIVSALLIVILSFLKIRTDQIKVNLLNENLLERDKQLTNKNLELVRSNDELSSFNYVTSHDLQEPLRKIQLFSNRIVEKEWDQLSQNAKEYFKRINVAAERMRNLIESLLTFSRTNITEEVFVNTDLNETLNEVQHTLQEMIGEKNAVIESETLPVISAIPIQLNQLFLNLISNSLKYSQPKISPHIKITAERIKSDEVPGLIKPNITFWKIIFKDNGIGFEQKYENKIFEPFQRLFRKSEYEGTGIGLAICKKIVASHNGIITAEGRQGNGATFTIFLPEGNIISSPIPHS